MKLKHITAAGLCAQLTLAIPHGVHHRHFHKRDVTTVHAVVTDVITVIDYNAVVWVDQAGNIVRTEHKTTTTTPVAATTTHVAVTTTSSVAVPSSAEPAASSSSSTQSVSSAGNFAAKNDNDHGNRIETPASSTPDTSAPVAAAPSAASSDIVNKGTTSAALISGFGVAYDAWDGANCRSTLDSDFAFLSSLGATTIRIYDVCFAEAARSASAHNLRLMVGITMFGDLDNHLYTLAKGITSNPPGWSVVDTVFIGNELVNKGLASSGEVAGKVSYARGLLKTQGWSGNVVTVDTWTQMRSDPTICSTSDYCAANAHAFFDGNTLPPNAGQFVRMAQSQVAAKNPGKRVVISESGWPHAGASVGQAVANVDNQRVAIMSIVKEFAVSPADLYLFMAYDAKYKVGDAEIERNFGIFDQDHYSGYL